MAEEPQPVRSTGPSLVISTQLEEFIAREFRFPRPVEQWTATLYPDALEAVVSCQFQSRPWGRVVPLGYDEGDEDEDPAGDVAWQNDRGDRAEEIARRAAGRLRRYVVANRLDRLGTLTYADACHDPTQARRDVGAFFRSLRAAVGRRFAYAWVPEWHPGGHGLHLHFAVGRFIPQRVIAEAWGRGIVDIRRRKELPFGADAVYEARQTARYLAKYAGKGFGDERPPGLHRFDVAQGFQPRTETVSYRRRREAVVALEARMGGPAVAKWRSESEPDWIGPPALWMAW